MTPIKTVAILGALALGAPGCKHDPKREHTPTKVETAGSAAPTSTELKLPDRTTTPPLKTTKPVDAPLLDKLRAMKWHGFVSDPTGGATMIVHHETWDHPKIKTTIWVKPCNNDCTPMDLAQWKDKPELKQYLAPALKTAPDTEFEVGMTDLNGAPIVYTYQLGQAFGPDGRGTYTDCYVIYYNDGVNQIEVLSSYTDDPVKSKDVLAKLVPKDALEATAKAFMDAYTHAWAPT